MSETVTTHLNDWELTKLITLLKKDEAKDLKCSYAKGIYGECPECGHICTYGENYCSNCGQRIMFKVNTDLCDDIGVGKGEICGTH